MLPATWDGVGLAAPFAVVRRQHHECVVEKSVGIEPIQELAHARIREGHRAVMLYLVNRSDCDRCGPAAEIDPVYAENLRKAIMTGVETIAYRARVGKRGITVADRIPFTLSV